VLNFRLNIGTDITFQLNGVGKLSEKVQQLNIRKVLIVTDRGIISTGLIDKVITELTEGNIKYDIYDGVKSNPTITNVNEAFSKFKSFGAEAVVSIGGGSSIDTGKGVAILGTNGGKIEDYFGAFKVREKSAPLFAIPTTAGTGSEVSTQISIKDEKTNIKHAIRSFYAVPYFAILDPQVLSTLPAKIAIETGMDTLSHLIEAYVSKGANPFTDALSIQGIEITGKYLTKFVSDRSNTEAASQMLVASMFGGIVLSYARTGAAHTLTRPMGEGVSHGLANAIVLPYVMEFNLMSNVEKFSRIAKALGGSVNGESMKDAEKSVEVVSKLNRLFGIPESFKEIGLEEDLNQLALKAYEMDISKLNPRELKVSDIKGIYEKVF
jgi:alcohol dehydrogenase class IV